MPLLLSISDAAIRGDVMLACMILAYLVVALIIGLVVGYLVILFFRLLDKM